MNYLGDIDENMNDDDKSSKDGGNQNGGQKKPRPPEQQVDMVEIPGLGITVPAVKQPPKKKKKKKVIREPLPDPYNLY